MLLGRSLASPSPRRRSSSALRLIGRMSTYAWILPTEELDRFTQVADSVPQYLFSTGGHAVNNTAPVRAGGMRIRFVEVPGS
jgi:hypothetical protein